MLRNSLPQGPDWITMKSFPKMLNRNTNHSSKVKIQNSDILNFLLPTFRTFALKFWKTAEIINSYSLSLEIGFNVKYNF